MLRCVRLERFSPRKSAGALRLPSSVPPASGASFGMKLFIEAHASISVPSTEKCSLDSNRLTRGWASTARRNRAAISPSSSRSRIFEKVEWSHTGSSRPSSGHAERLAALDMIEGFADRPRAVTLGADKSYDAADFVEELRTINVRPHVARNTSGRRSAIDRRTTRHSGYAKSQLIRKRIEEAFGWIKTVAGLRKTKLRGLPKVDWSFTFAAAAYNLVWAPKLIGGGTATPAVAVGRRSAPPAVSSAISSFIKATIQVSSPSASDFFNSLLVPPSRPPAAAFSRRIKGTSIRDVTRQCRHLLAGLPCQRAYCPLAGLPLRSRSRETWLRSRHR